MALCRRPITIKFNEIGNNRDTFPGFHNALSAYKCILVANHVDSDLGAKCLLPW